MKIKSQKMNEEKELKSFKKKLKNGIERAIKKRKYSSFLHHLKYRTGLNKYTNIRLKYFLQISIYQQGEVF